MTKNVELNAFSILMFYCHEIYKVLNVTRILLPVREKTVYSMFEQNERIRIDPAYEGKQYDIYFSSEDR